MNKITEQEEFWKGDFGDNYIKRNKSEMLLASNMVFFSKALRMADTPKSVLEFGANIGMNLKALKTLYPNLQQKGIEINEKAAQELVNLIGSDNVANCSLTDYEVTKKFDLTLIKTVLIHINPELLDTVYKKLYKASSKYILICEYYNPSPTEIVYRGHKSKLFKRDFAGEMLDKFSDLELVDYGFSYHRDKSFPQDDINWFLLKKNNAGEK